MRSGQAAGIDTTWIDPVDTRSNGRRAATHEIRALDEIVRTGAPLVE